MIKRPKLFKNKNETSVKDEVRAGVKLMLFMALVMFIMCSGMILYLQSETMILATKHLNDKSLDYSNEELAGVIASYCGLQMNDYEKAYCVNEFVRESGRFKYEKSMFIKDFNKLLEEGGDCKSWSVFYNSIFKKLGFGTSYVYTKDHVYLSVFKNDVYCNVDQLSIDCHYVS